MLIHQFAVVDLNTGSPKVIDARRQAISRGVHSGIAFANFKAHKFSYLNITSLGTDYVLSVRECGLACVNIPSCFSFNLAFFSLNLADINRRILCELLSVSYSHTCNCYCCTSYIINSNLYNCNHSQLKIETCLALIKSELSSCFLNLQAVV